MCMCFVIENKCFGLKSVKWESDAHSTQANININGIVELDFEFQ